MLIPIIEKFGLLKKKLGKAIIGIGILDNLFEYSVLLLAVIFGLQSSGEASTIVIAVLATLAASAFILIMAKIKYIKEIIKNSKNSILFILSFGVLFILSAVASIGNLEIIGALIAALIISKIIPQERKEKLQEYLSVVSDGFFAPIFFLWIGLSTNILFLAQKPILSLAFVLIGILAKLIPILISTYKDLGWRGSVILGIALKFGSGIIFIKILFEQGLIDELIYTITISAILIYRIVNPAILGTLVKKWEKHIV